MQIDQLPAGLYTADGVRELDRLAIEAFGIPGLTLMRRAGDACVRTLQTQWPMARRVTVYCGSGNNAGDGFIIGGILAEKGFHVTVVAVGDTGKLGADALEAYRYCASSRANLVSFAEHAREAAAVDVVVDALLGTGLSGTVRAEYVDAIESLNASAVPVLSVDIPSGLDADTGSSLGCAVRATVTVTFIGLKRGLFTFEGPDLCGDIVFDDLDVPAGVYERNPASASRLSLDVALTTLPLRPKNAHKNKFGHVLVVGGDQGMGGAASMSAEAALRCGAGLVSVATHPDHVPALLARRPELMVKGVTDPMQLMPLIARATVIVLGPGLGRTDWSTSIFRKVMAEIDPEEQQMVLDADGLNLLALQPEARSNWVLTPHPGEASNLLQDNMIQADRFRSVTELQCRYGGTVLLKGAGTVVCDGETLALCPYGNPGMSTAGMGDVLSGIIGSLLAQGLAPGDATRLGVVVHAIAGDRCAAEGGERGILATDLFDHARRLLNP